MMRNAWFNIAVEDLRSRDCRSAIEHFGHELFGSGQSREYAQRFSVGHDDGQPLRSFGAYGTDGLVEVEIQDVAIEKQ